MTRMVLVLSFCSEKEGIMAKQAGQFQGFAGTLGVSYSHNHVVSCPTCPEERWVRIRDNKFRIMYSTACSACGARYRIIIAEDPARQLGQDSLDRMSAESLKKAARAFCKANPAVIPAKPRRW